MKTKEIIEKIKQSIEVAIVPVSAICGIWGLDIATYVAATGSLLISILTYVELFIKD